MFLLFFFNELSCCCCCSSLLIMWKEAKQMLELIKPCMVNSIWTPALWKIMEILIAIRHLTTVPASTSSDVETKLMKTYSTKVDYRSGFFGVFNDLKTCHHSG